MALYFHSTNKYLSLMPGTDLDAGNTGEQDRQALTSWCLHSSWVGACVHTWQLSQ